MNTPMASLVELLLDGDQKRAIAQVGMLRDSGVDREQIVTDGIQAAMDKLNEKCTLEQFNLLEIMLSGRAVMGIMQELYPRGGPIPPVKGTIVIATLEGDVHDLGKTILNMALTAKGYHVVDCGKDCPLGTLIENAQRDAVVAVGVSGLITSVIPQVREVKNKLVAQGLEHIRVLAGGAALKQASAESLDVDFVAQTAFDGVGYLDRIAGSTL